MLALFLPAAGKTQYFSHSNFNSILQIINSTFSGLQKSLMYFNGATIVAFFRIPLARYGLRWAAVSPNNLALYLKDLKLFSLAISALKLVA